MPQCLSDMFMLVVADLLVDNEAAVLEVLDTAVLRGLISCDV